MKCMKKNKYKIVSLGYNCEVSSRIREIVKGEFDSYPFSWVYIGSIQKFVDALKNIDDILKNDIVLLPSGMVKDVKYDISFHLKKIYNNIEDEKERLNKRIAELKSRFAHLVSKFKKLLKSKQKTLFIIKYKKNENINTYFDIVKFFIENYTSKNFKILIVFEGEVPTKFYENNIYKDFVLSSTVKEFAKDTETETGGDIEGWHSAIKSVVGNCVYKNNILIKSFKFLKENGLIAFFNRIFKHK